MYAAVIGDRFLARDLTIENTASPEMYQAVAIRVTSNSAFFRCNFTSNQDTLYAHSLRQFYRECVIQGTIDFIFGNAAAIFHNCRILARKPIPGQSNMITAQSREDPNQNTGFSLHNCTIEAAPDFSLLDRKRCFTFLGRPWRNYSRTIVMRSYLGDLIHPLGWSQWDEYSNLNTVEYMEYMNFGLLELFCMALMTGCNPLNFLCFTIHETYLHDLGKHVVHLHTPFFKLNSTWAAPPVQAIHLPGDKMSLATCK